MTKNEYLAELRENLMSLSPEERDDAVRFYDEYFEDAGKENEAAVIEELGKPFTLAKNIICEQSAYSKSKSYAKLKASRSMGLGNSSSPKENADADEDIMPNSSRPNTQYTAYGYENETADKSPFTETTGGSYEEYKENYGSSSDTESKSYKTSYGGNIVMLVLGILFCAFVGFPILLAILAVLFAFALAVIGLGIGAIVCLIVAIVRMSTAGMGTGLAMMGIAMILAGLGLILAGPTVLGIFKLIPALLKGTVKFFKKYAKGVM
jgi:uncharacterized membrane protein